MKIKGLLDIVKREKNISLMFGEITLKLQIRDEILRRSSRFMNSLQ